MAWAVSLISLLTCHLGSGLLPDCGLSSLTSSRVSILVALLLLAAIHVMAISIQDHWAFLGLLFVFLSNGLISPLGPLAMSAYRLSCPIYFLLGILDPF